MAPAGANPHAQVNWAGTTSMEVGARVMADRWNDTVPATHVASAYLVMVAVDDEGHPRPVPPILPNNDDDRHRFRQAQERRSHRLNRRRSGGPPASQMVRAVR